MASAGSQDRTQTPKPTAAVDDPLVGKILNGRFKILEPLGVGGMGKVYRAIQLPLERVVAVKVLSPNFEQSRDPGFQKRFLREASLTSKLRHPNTVTVIDYGQSEDGILYIAMEFLEGHTLAEVLTRSRQLEYVRAIGITGQVARSLREAHALGVIHRDLKPANVMLIPDKDQDVVKVLDFGLVKSFVPDGQAPQGVEITQSGTFLGSPQYMAPEQARNQSDPRSDVYSLGVLLYQMLTGRPPFLSKDYLEVIFQHHKEPPPPFRQVRPDLEIPGPVEALVMKCLAKDPAARYQSMDELIEAIRVAGMTAGGSGVFRATLAATTTGTYAQPQSLFGVAVKDEGAIEIDLGESGLRSKKVLIGAVAGGAILLGMLLVFLLGRGGEPASAPANAKAAVAEGAIPEDEGADAPAAEITQTGEKGATVKFRIGSIPAGANVFVAGKKVGKTPTQLEVPADSDGTATAEITFALDGYHTLTLVAGGSGTVVLTQPLQKRPTREPRPNARAGAAPAVANAGPVLEVEAAPNVQRAPAPEDTPVVSASMKGSDPAAGGNSGLTVLPFGEGMTRPELLQGSEIVYTREARQAKVQGLMVVKCVITTSGKLERCRVLKSVPLMEAAVLEALQTRVYRPATFQGRPVAVDYVFNLRLTLPR